MDYQNSKNNSFDVGTLADTELKQKIFEMNDRQLTLIRDMSYYYLFGRVGEISKLINDDKFLDGYNIGSEKEAIIRICKRIINSFKKYNLDISDEESNNEVNELLNVREDLYYLFNSLYGYSVEISYIRELSEYGILKYIWENQYNSYNIEREEVNYVINKIKALLSDSNMNYNRFIGIVSNILAVIPFRMSKYKYFDLIQSTLTRNLISYTSDIVENLIERYKMSFDSTLLGDYGILFDNYFTEIQRFKSINLNDKSLDELRAIIDEISKLDDTINEISKFINNLGIMVNRLIVLYLLKNKIAITSDIDNDHQKWNQYLKDRMEKMLESLLKLSDKKLENREKELLDSIQNFDVVIQEAVKRNMITNDDINAVVNNTRKILTFYNDLNLTKYETLMSDNIKYGLIDKDYLDQLVNSLIQYINRSVYSMSSIERKIRMRRLLSMIELPFKNLEEFLDYVQSSFDEKVVSKGEMAFTLDTLNHILDEHV